jgi:hypothetical protein
MGNVRLYGATSGYTELAPPAVAPDGVLSLPSGTGTIAKTTDQGLVHINTTTFSAVSSVSLNDVFTSDYENYLATLTVLGNATVALLCRMRASGTDNSSAVYSAQYNLAEGSSLYASRTTAQTSGRFGGVSTVDSSYEMHIYKPQLAAVTNITNFGNFRSGGGISITSETVSVDVSTAYDGMTIFPSSGTITGSLRIYGYKNGA